MGLGIYEVTFNRLDMGMDVVNFILQCEEEGFLYMSDDHTYYLDEDVINMVRPEVYNLLAKTREGKVEKEEIDEILEALSKFEDMVKRDGLGINIQLL